MKIESAHRNDAKKITELTIRSKDYWKYGEEQIAEWKDELTISAKYICDNRVYKLVSDSEIIGFYAFQSENEKKVKLNFLFIEPKFIGKGFGKILLTNFVYQVKSEGFKIITLDADPNARVFYEKYGFRAVGKLKSSIKDRFLPIMELEIENSQQNV